MFSLIHDIKQCPNNNVSLEEAKSALSTHTWKTARRILDLIYEKKGHKYVAPNSKIGDYAYGMPIHKLNTRLITRSNSGIDISKIRLKNIPENDAFWLQKGETIIEDDDFFMNDTYAFRLLKGGSQEPNNTIFQGVPETR